MSVQRNGNNRNESVFATVEAVFLSAETGTARNLFDHVKGLENIEKCVQQMSFHNTIIQNNSIHK